MFRFAFWFGFFLFALEGKSSHLGSGPHIADVNILLPPKMTNPVEYLLQGSDGCFIWSWDHHDILSVITEYNTSSHCSTSARLRSIAPYNGRRETAVYATDVQTGIVIRCKVFIDNFSRIQIFHNSIKLDLDGLATLRVRAFDGEENEFSSLVGLQFMWQMMPETAGLPHHLVHVPLKESPLTDCGGLCGYLNTQIKLEDSGVFSDLFVVKGTEIGHEKVSVHLLEPHLKHMGDEIVFTVAEAMSLDPPSPVFVLIGAAFHYRLIVMRGSIPQAVTLPSPYHRWSVLNSSVAQVNSMSGLTHALTLGVTTVVVEDIRVAGHIQGSLLNVVLPDTLWLYIAPLSVSGGPLDGSKPVPSLARWYVVSGHQYVIQIKVFSQGPDPQEIFITKRDDIKLYENKTNHWEAYLAPDNIASRHGWQSPRILNATSSGLGKLTATLTYYNGYQKSKEVLKVVQEVMVCEQVRFSLKWKNGTAIVVLPWIESVYQEMELLATGGCAKASSDYKWFSSDIASVSVSAYGIIQAKKPGKATVKVVSVFDAYNYDEVVVEVSVPASMVMLQKFPVETVVTSHLQAALTMKAPNGASYSRCDSFSSQIKWKTGSESFVIVNATVEMPSLNIVEDNELYESSPGPPCSWTKIYASSPGRTMLHATLSKDYHHFGSSFSEPVVLKTAMCIGAYPPLILKQIGDGNHFGGYWLETSKRETESEWKSLDKLFLAPGTFMNVILLGGPEKWGENVDFTETVEIFSERHDRSNGVLVHQIVDNFGSQYGVSCRRPGDYKLGFTRGNSVGIDHPLPAIAEITLSVACRFPSSIVLIIDEPVNDLDAIRAAIQADRDPEQIRATPVTVANGQTIRIAAVGISKYGEAFANSSSLHLSWELSQCDSLAYWDDAFDSDKPVSSWERILALRDESGLCIVRASVSDYGDHVGGRSSESSVGGSENYLTDAVRLQLVSTLRVSPGYKLVFFSPDAKVNLSITGGSCFWEAAVNDTQVAALIETPPALQCLQVTLSPKGLGTAVVTVNDIGVSPPLSAVSTVHVADVDWIKIVSGEGLSLIEGTSESIDLLAGIDDGSTFDQSQYAFMDINVHIEDDIVELVSADNAPHLSNGYMTSPTFTVAARRLGFTTLYVSCRQKSGHTISSQAINIEVYSPPRLHPPEIFLVPGASYAFTIVGGPTIGVSVEYTATDERIVKINKSLGHLCAVSTGNTTVIARIYGKEKKEICQAYGSVKVGVPSSATLVAQSDMLAIGSQMPLFPSFPEGDLLSFGELCKNYKWTIEDGQVLSFVVAKHLDRGNGDFTVFGEVEFSSNMDEKEPGFISVLHGRSAGKTKVTLTFECDFIFSASHSIWRTYHASIPLSVVPDLPLVLGSPMTWVLPPFYTSSSLLPSSFEAHSQQQGQSQKGKIIYSLLRNCDAKDQAIRDEISIDVDRIRTTESNNIACIQAKDRTSGRIGVASCIRVAEVAQIRVAGKRLPLHAFDLAIGDELEVPISYYDALGIPFYEANNAIIHHVETNHRDIVSIRTSDHSEANINIKGVQHGKALVRVSIGKSPQKADYILVSVGAHIYPQNPVVRIGNSVNFSVNGGDDKISGRWLSANRSVLSVDVLSGEAKGVQEGSTFVRFESQGTKLQTIVTVVSGNVVYVDAPKETLTNAPFRSNGYSFPLKFSGENKFSDLKNVNKIGYKCQVDPPFIGYAKPWMDLHTAKPYCLFFPYSPDHLAYSIPYSRDMKPYMSVSVSASLEEADNVSGSASALFVGGFSIPEMGKDAMLLNLTPASDKTIISIVGNTDVEIYWQNRNLLSVSRINKEGFGFGGRAQYEVRVLKPKSFKDKIVVTLPTTGQRVEVDVNYVPSEGPPPRDKFQSILLLQIFATVAVMTIIAIVFFSDILGKGRASQPSTSSTLRNPTAPETPEPRTPVVYHDQSPRTPPPFVDYVRRTIDETPYYRREARRRFNLQNTM